MEQAVFEINQSDMIGELENAEMSGLINKVPALLERKGWDANTFAAYCLLNKIGQSTAYRLARGEVNFNISTLAEVAKVLGVKSIADIIDIDPDQ